ncbi:MAG: hypothetical protein ABI900_11590 [Betaproteobacteria bacterium]
MRFAAFAALIALCFCIAPAARADEDKLPAQLAGTGSTTLDSGKTTTAPWSISITSQDADGNLKGTMNWNGRTCQVSAVPFTGTYRNGVLDISAPATSSRCGAWTITLTRSSGEALLLEGTARSHGTDNPLAVSLRQR